MELDAMFKGLSVSATGLLAERVRMGLIATNIAHARDTDRGDGTPYKRQLAVFQTILDGELEGGVRVKQIIEDSKTPHPRIEARSHPDADADGMLTLPNVDPSFEMVDLLTAARSYEANLQALQASVKMAEQALQLMR